MCVSRMLACPRALRACPRSPALRLPNTCSTPPFRMPALPSLALPPRARCIVPFAPPRPPRFWALDVRIPSFLRPETSRRPVPRPPLALKPHSSPIFVPCTLYSAASRRRRPIAPPHSAFPCPAPAFCPYRASPRATPHPPCTPYLRSLRAILFAQR